MGSICITGRFRLIKLIAFLAALVFLSGMMNVCVSSDEGERMVLSDANVSFVPFEKWIGVTKSGMDQKALDAIPIAYTTMKDDFDDNNGWYYSVNSTRLRELYVTSFADDRSKKIYSTADGSYPLINEYLSSPVRFKYIRRRDKINITSCTDKITTDDGAVFYIVEYDCDKTG